MHFHCLTCEDGGQQRHGVPVLELRDHPVERRHAVRPLRHAHRGVELVGRRPPQLEARQPHAAQHGEEGLARLRVDAEVESFVCVVILVEV